MPTPNVRPYRLARRAARRRMLALDRDTQQRIQRVVDDYIRRVTALLESAPPNRRAAFQATIDASRAMARRLEGQLIAVGERRRAMSFDATRDIWREASERIAAAEGVPGALMGAVRAPPITLLGAFEAMGTDRDWRTLVRGHARNAAEEVQAVLSRGIAEGSGPREVARALRQYVQGSEPLAAFMDGEGAIDLRRIPQELRGAARQMTFNAERIAMTEIHAARHEAELQHQLHDPFTAANQWTLSPDRGSARVPDGCDFLASADYYGLGRGIYPVHATPSMVHPFDRCEIIPVPRPLADMDKPKPAPGRASSPMRETVPGSNKLTDVGLRRARQDATKAILVGESAIQSRLRQGRAV